ncbi:serine hydrolase domain-containing protein, partial [Microbacterium marinilacus]
MVPPALEREGIVGATVSVVLDGEIVAERGYGYAEVGDDETDPRPVDGSTLFRIGSISKVVTATAVMQLVEQGSLDLDDPIQDHLDFDLPVSFETPVTVRHLLTHSAGFEDELAGLITSPDSPTVSLRDAVSIDPPEQIFEPGTTPAYSNYSNGLAGYIVERVSGEPFEQYVEEHVFEPAGMDTASVTQPLAAEDQQRMSAGYRFAGSDPVPFEVVSPAPAGAVSATSSDMARFMLAQLGAGDRPLLEEASLERMHAPALDSDDLGGLAAGPRMTLGFFEDARGGHRVLSHAGDLTAFHAQLELYPDDGAGIFISLNSSGVRDDSSTAVRELVAAGFADRYLPADGEETPAALPEAADHAAAIAGTYQLSRRGESTFIRAFFIASAVAVTDRGEGVVSVSAITDAAGQPVDLVEVEPWVWREVGGDRVVAADVRDGEVVAVGLSPAFTLQPMPAHRAAFPLVALASALIIVAFLAALPIAALARRVSRGRRASS